MPKDLFNHECSHLKKNIYVRFHLLTQIHHHFEFSNGVKEFHEENDEYEPFPTLEEALNKIDESCGFNIELKWDMMLKDGSNECHFPFEINLFLDTVLKVN